MVRDPFEHGMRSSDEGVRRPCQHTKPCGDCPWRRKAIPGWLGENSPEEWLRIAHSDAIVDCHTIINQQCAGIAIYRRNVAKRCDPPNITLPADKEAVFAWPSEFLEHHQRRLGMPIPIVPTGPTKGQERSRNRNGQWRKKRDDAGKKRS